MLQRYNNNNNNNNNNYYYYWKTISKWSRSINYFLRSVSHGGMKFEKRWFSQTLSWVKTTFQTSNTIFRVNKPLKEYKIIISGGIFVFKGLKDCRI